MATDAKTFVEKWNKEISRLSLLNIMDEERLGTKYNVSLVDQAEPWMWAQIAAGAAADDNGEDAIWEMADGSFIKWVNVERRYEVSETGNLED